MKNGKLDLFVSSFVRIQQGNDLRNIVWPEILLHPAGNQTTAKPSLS